MFLKENKEPRKNNYEVLYITSDADVTRYSISGVFTFIFNEKNELLTIRNPRGRDIPGGHVELGEHPIQCIERETNEESGLQLSKEDFIPFALVDVHSPEYPRAVMLFTVAHVKENQQKTLFSQVKFESKELFLSEYSQMEYIPLMTELLVYLGSYGT